MTNPLQKKTPREISVHYLSFWTGDGSFGWIINHDGQEGFSFTELQGQQ